MSTIAPLVEQRNNQLVVSCQPELGSMYGDSTKIRQTLLNLLSNASKFTENGRVELKVERETVDHQAWIVMQVIDTGIGMNAEQMARLFKPFTQADASTSSKFGGTGLGLAISKQFAQMMGGDITLTSAPGAGSTFTLRVPGRVKSASSPYAAAEKEPKEHQPAPAPKGRVLVIDDDESVHGVLTNMLTREGYSTRIARDGKDGLRIALEYHPDIVILDILMPGVDGWSVLSQLKATPGLEDVPIILLTMLENKEMGFALGAAEYLTKPIDASKLLPVLDRHRSMVLYSDLPEDTRQGYAQPFTLVCKIKDPTIYGYTLKTASTAAPPRPHRLWGTFVLPTVLPAPIGVTLYTVTTNANNIGTYPSYPQAITCVWTGN